MSSQNEHKKIGDELDLLYRLKAADVSLHYKPQGATILNLTPGQALQLLIDENQLVGNLLGLSVNQYIQWRDSGTYLRKKRPNSNRLSARYIQYTANTISGKRCRNAADGPLDAKTWLNHKESLCATHRKSNIIAFEANRLSPVKPK